jgi:hypothetical protein
VKHNQYSAAMDHGWRRASIGLAPMDQLGGEERVKHCGDGSCKSFEAMGDSH